MENIISRENLQEFGNNLIKLENEAASTTGRFASAIGKGILAGLAGTAAITATKTIEARLTGKQDGHAPAEVANQVLGTSEVNPEMKEDFNNKVRWGYGSAWGAVRGILKEAGMPSWAATATHFAGVYGTALVMLPKSKVAPPLKEWGAKAIAIDAVHHAVYATVTGLVYDAIDVKDNRYERLVEAIYDHELEMAMVPEIEVLEIETEYYGQGDE